MVLEGSIAPSGMGERRMAPKGGGGGIKLVSTGGLGMEREGAGECATRVGREEEKRGAGDGEPDERGGTWSGSDKGRLAGLPPPSVSRMSGSGGRGGLDGRGRGWFSFFSVSCNKVSRFTPSSSLFRSNPRMEPDNAS